MEDHFRGSCSRYAFDYFSERMRGQKQQLMRVNRLMVANSILAGILVGVGAYGPRYRHRAFIRFFFQGATILFLPIVSNGATTDSSTPLAAHKVTISWVVIVLKPSASGTFVVHKGTCTKSYYGQALFKLLESILVQQSLPMIEKVETLVSLWCYLYKQSGPHTFWSTTQSRALAVAITDVYAHSHIFGITCSVYALIFARMVFKYYAFQKTQRSFALGRNPRLIVGYMEQLQEEIQHVGPTVEHLPPPLIVMGEDRQQVEKQPCGYGFKRMPNQDDMTMMNNNNGLVTIDKVWQLDDMILTSIPRLRDVYFSFALFKLLQCRFAGYTVAEAGFLKARNFFWHVVLMDDDHERVLGIIIDELSFLHDYYYLSLPISYSKRWLPILSIFFSLMTISYSLFLGTVFSWQIILTILKKDYYLHGQILCWVRCGESGEQNVKGSLGFLFPFERPTSSFGNQLFDDVPIFLLLALVVLVEVKDIASYICRYVMNHDTRQRSPSMQRWVGRVLQRRCKLMNNWDDKMNQCSVLVPHLRKTPTALRSRLLRLPDQKKNVKVPTVVKAAIIDALRSNDGLLSNGESFLRRSLQAGDNFLWACNGEGTADTILMWHIATSILEVRHPHSPASDDKITATHLSRYCAYLVAYVPELLPDDEPWCKSLYKAVKDSMRVLDGGAEAEGYEKLVALLSERSEHELLKKAGRLGKQLAELTEPEGEEAAWRVLAGFWSEMILYVAPSDNLNGHAEAIARGGELITLLWALLMHAGIATRPSTAAAAPATSV